MQSRVLVNIVALVTERQRSPNVAFAADLDNIARRSSLRFHFLRTAHTR